MIIDVFATSSLHGGNLSKEWYALIGVVVGTVATLLVGLITGWWNRGTEQRKIDLDQQKFLAEQRKEVKPDFLAAGEAMGTVVLADAEIKARGQEALKARRALLSIAYTHELLSAENEFRNLLTALSSPDEASLATAARAWPHVEQMILRGWPGGT